MAALHRQSGCVASALLVPLLTLASPGFLLLAGAPPAWGVLWLLPWALVDGPLSGAAAGLGLGLMLDGLHPAAGWSASQIPALVLLGWWWGRLGRQGPPIERSWNLALLALLGSLLLGASLWLQFGFQALLASRGERLADPSGDLGVDPARFASPTWLPADLSSAGLQILLAQALVTGLLALPLCSLQLLLWRHRIGQSRG